MIQDITAIDIHSHINHGTPYDSLSNDSRIYKAEYDFLCNMYDRTNIEQAVFSTFASVLHTEPIVEENEYLHKLVLENKRAYQWVVVDPRQKKTFEQADRMLDSKKVLGIKIMPGMHGYDIMEYGDSLFSFASERKTTILIHPTPNHADECTFAAKYPESKLILAHLTGKMHADCLENDVNGNVYADTSSSASTFNNGLEYVVERVGADRIFFGTDTYASGFQRGRIEYAGISDEDKVKILRNNALRVFSKNFL